MLILFRKITVHFCLKYCYIKNVKNFLTFSLVFFFASALLAEFRMERVICTTKKTSNCGAYIYNSKTGEVYFCDSENCTEVDTPIEIIIEEEVEEPEIEGEELEGEEGEEETTESPEGDRKPGQDGEESDSPKEEQKE